MARIEELKYGHMLHHFGHASDDLAEVMQTYAYATCIAKGLPV